MEFLWRLDFGVWCFRFTPFGREAVFCLAEDGRRTLLCLRLWDHASGDGFCWQPRQARRFLLLARSTPWVTCRKCKRSISIPWRMSGSRRLHPARRRPRNRLRPISFPIVVRPLEEREYGENRLSDIAAEDCDDAPGRSLHCRQRSGRAVLLLRDEFHPGRLHDQVSFGQDGSFQCHASRKG